MSLILWLRAVGLLRLGRAEIERSRMLAEWSQGAMDRAQARFAAAQAIADRMIR